MILFFTLKGKHSSSSSTFRSTYPYPKPHVYMLYLFQAKPKLSPAAICSIFYGNGILTAVLTYEPYFIASLSFLLF
jgi:hypothetical protein